jgi:hypothetical protein
MSFEEVTSKKRGLIAGYEPNRISLYILLLHSGRQDELLEILYKDMEQYKINPNNKEKGESNV